jgi:hypothetical protein
MGFPRAILYGCIIQGKKLEQKNSKRIAKKISPLTAG